MANSLLFEHIDQEKTYSEYAIKNGDLLDESTINAFCKRLKKEIDDVYNLLCAFASLPLQEFNPATEYEKGELVRYTDAGVTKNYLARGTTVGNLPTDTAFWTEFLEYASGQSMIRLADYLSKTNQVAYDPGAKTAGEASIDYHPVTVKFLEDRIKATLNTEYNALLKRIEALEAKP